MTLGRLRLSVADARDLGEGALRSIGYDNDEARIIADHVIDAATCGYEYSGLAKILNVPESEHFRLPRRSMKVLRETEVSLAFDGGNNVGMLALFHAAQATIKKTAAHGIALVSVIDAWMSGKRELIRARTGEGRKRAKDRGVRFGRRKMTPLPAAGGVAASGRRRDDGRCCSQLRGRRHHDREACGIGPFRARRGRPVRRRD